MANYHATPLQSAPPTTAQVTYHPSITYEYDTCRIRANPLSFIRREGGHGQTYSVNFEVQLKMH